ncbi:hypothetical protein H2248_001311 [Termitomyces sp. 'cryptogamus']|nr:hypothetical protein H2248_001311 [Termitomyces sp. 'cryptogamus']
MRYHNIGNGALTRLPSTARLQHSGSTRLIFRVPMNMRPIGQILRRKVDEPIYIYIKPHVFTTDSRNRHVYRIYAFWFPLQTGFPSSRTSPPVVSQGVEITP